MKLSWIEGTRFLKYAAVGVVTNVLLYLLFLLLLRLSVSAVLAATVCYLLGVAISYVLNRRWTFSSSGGHEYDLPRFLVAYGVGLVATIFILSALVDFLPAEIAQVANIAVTASIIYVCLRTLNFGMGK